MGREVNGLVHVYSRRSDNQDRRGEKRFKITL
jgi:hypothetical protein